MKQWRNELKKTLMSHVACRMNTESRDTTEAMEQQKAEIRQTKRRMHKATNEYDDEQAAELKEELAKQQEELEELSKDHARAMKGKDFITGVFDGLVFQMQSILRWKINQNELKELLKRIKYWQGMFDEFL